MPSLVFFSSQTSHHSLHTLWYRVGVQRIIASRTPVVVPPLTRDAQSSTCQIYGVEQLSGMQHTQKQRRPILQAIVLQLLQHPRTGIAVKYELLTIRLLAVASAYCHSKVASVLHACTTLQTFLLSIPSSTAQSLTAKTYLESPLRALACRLLSICWPTMARPHCHTCLNSSIGLYL